jgi:hypothetical protein
MRIGSSAHGLATDRDDVAADIAEPGHEFLEASTELVRIQPTEGVVIRYSVSQSEKLAEEVLLGLANTAISTAVRPPGNMAQSAVVITSRGSWRREPLGRGSFNSAKQVPKTCIFPPSPFAGPEGCQISTAFSKSRIGLPIDIDNISTVRQNILSK